MSRSDYPTRKTDSNNKDKGITMKISEEINSMKGKKKTKSNKEKGESTTGKRRKVRQNKKP